MHLTPPQFKNIFVDDGLFHTKEFFTDRSLEFGFKGGYLYLTVEQVNLGVGFTYGSRFRALTNEAMDEELKTSVYVGGVLFTDEGVNLRYNDPTDGVMLEVFGADLVQCGTEAIEILGVNDRDSVLDVVAFVEERFPFSDAFLSKVCRAYQNN